jgi:hypothetical protein
MCESGLVLCSMGARHTCLLSVSQYVACDTCGSVIGGTVLYAERAGHSSNVGAKYSVCQRVCCAQCLSSPAEPYNPRRRATSCDEIHWHCVQIAECAGGRYGPFRHGQVPHVGTAGDVRPPDRTV